MKNYRLPDVQVVTKTQIHRNFSEDQKLQIVKEALVSGMSIAAYSREVDIAANVLFKWRKRFVDAGKLPPLPNWEPKGLSPNPGENGFIQIGNAMPAQSAIRITVGSDIIIALVEYRLLPPWCVFLWRALLAIFGSTYE